MPFLTRIMLSGVTGLADARYAAAAGLEYISFCFDPASPSYIPPVKAREIVDWTTGSSIVASFGEQEMSEIITIADLLNVDVVELDNRILPQDVAATGKALIKKIDVSVFDEEGVLKEVEAYAPQVDAFHLHSTGVVNAGEEFLKRLCASHKIIWGLPLNAGSAVSVIGEFQPYAISLSASFEEQTGIRDFDELNDLLEKLECE